MTGISLRSGMGQLLEALDARRGSAGAEDLDEQEARAAEGQQVDGGA